jgi:hypothetical protein
MLLSLLAAAGQDLPDVVVQRPAAPADTPGGIVVPQDTLIRLMVLNEVSSRRARPGDRFPLRVDAPVVVGGVTVVAAGARAWGEIVSSEASGHVGRAGSLSARLVSVEVGGEQVPLGGEASSGGEAGTLQVGIGMLALGPLALLAPGNNAKLKAGDIFNGHLPADMLFDPAAAKLRPLPRQNAQ